MNWEFYVKKEKTYKKAIFKRHYIWVYPVEPQWRGDSILSKIYKQGLYNLYNMLSRVWLWEKKGFKSGLLKVRKIRFLILKSLKFLIVEVSSANKIVITEKINI